MIKIILLLGGAALFLFGISLMGDGLKIVAGNKLQLILYKLSGTVMKGIFLGTGVTAVIQSSSATSVMVVGFVNSGMMKLRQAISIIMGAIIGTSITGWVICLSEIGSTASGVFSLFSTESLAAMTAVIGILLRFISKKKKSEYISYILFGFSILMFGMKTMSEAMSDFRTNPYFINLLTTFSNPLIGILFGIVFTSILQSASAAVGILQVISVTGIIRFDQALPVIMGIAIGASVPVLFSSLGAETNAKRSACSYLIVDVLGAAIFGAIFYTLNLIIKFEFFDSLMTTVSIAALNTLFRVIIIVLLVPFIGFIEKLAASLVKENPDETYDTEEIKRLDERFIVNPTLAVEQSKLTVNAMAERVRKSLGDASALIEKYTDAGYTEVVRLEDVIDRYEDKIGSYLTRLTCKEMDSEHGQAVTKYLHSISDFERIGDHALNIAENAQEIKEKKIEFTAEGDNEVRKLILAMLSIVDITFDAFISDDIETAYRVEPFEQVIDNMCDTIKLHHSERLGRGECSLMNGYVFNDIIINVERVSDHCSNIATAMIELATGRLDMHVYKIELENNHINHFDEYYDEYMGRYGIDR